MELLPPPSRSGLLTPKIHAALLPLHCVALVAVFAAANLSCAAASHSSPSPTHCLLWNILLAAHSQDSSQIVFDSRASFLLPSLAWFLMHSMTTEHLRLPRLLSFPTLAQRSAQQGPDSDSRAHLIVRRRNITSSSARSTCFFRAAHWTFWPPCCIVSCAFLIVPPKRPEEKLPRLRKPRYATHGSAANAYRSRVAHTSRLQQ